MVTMWFVSSNDVDVGGEGVLFLFAQNASWCRESLTGQAMLPGKKVCKLDLQKEEKRLSGATCWR